MTSVSALWRLLCSRSSSNCIAPRPKMVVMMLLPYANTATSSPCGVCCFGQAVVTGRAGTCTQCEDKHTHCCAVIVVGVWPSTTPGQVSEWYCRSPLFQHSSLKSPTVPYLVDQLALLDQRHHTADLRGAYHHLHICTKQTALTTAHHNTSVTVHTRCRNYLNTAR